MHELRTKAAPLAVLGVLLAAFTLQRLAAGQLVQAVAVDLMVLIVAALVVWPTTRWLLPAVAPLLAAGALAQFAVQSEVPLRVVVPAVLGFAFAVLLALGVEVGRGIDAAVRAVGRVLEAVVGAIAFVILILPAWAFTRLRRRDVLRTPAAAGGPTWSVRADRPAPASMAASPEFVGRRRSLFGTLTWCIGCVTVLLAVNFGIGWLWDQAYPTDPPEDAAPEQTQVSDVDLPPDPRADTPAMAGAPWRDRYFDDIRRTPGGYWPFTEYKPADFSSPYVNQKGWVRRSYEPGGDPDTMPTVWMFGGSTTWGEGQRDQHTIASYLARIAEDAGVPLRIRNYGARGWVHYQEMILYEQELAQRAAPDFVVFNDGANEITSQSLIDAPVPTHVLTYAYARKLFGTTVATQFLPTPQQDESTVADAVAVYEEHSAIHKVVAWFRGSPAGANPAQEDDPSGGGTDPAIPDQPNADADGNVWNYTTTVQDGIDAGDVYERGKDLTLHLSQEHGVEPVLFWQPVRYVGPSEKAAAERITDPTIDLRDALDGHEDVYIDGVHTNEEGARIVAEAMWEHLGPKIRAWYREHR